MFESIKGSCQQRQGTTSFYNAAEVNAVMRFVKQILLEKWNKRTIHASDIGIISPYIGQCNLIRSKCQAAGFDNITVGTAEVFQGQEKPVIIISTVRTGRSLGFVKDERVGFVYLKFYIKNITNYLFLPFLEIKCHDHSTNCLVSCLWWPWNAKYWQILGGIHYVLWREGSCSC